MGADPDEEGGSASAACPHRCLLARLLLNGSAKPTSSRHAVPDVVVTHPGIKGLICILAQTAHPAFTVSRTECNPTYCAWRSDELAEPGTESVLKHSFQLEQLLFNLFIINPVHSS